MKTLYLDCFSGISGDMLLGALIDCGVDAGLLVEQLASLSCAGEFSLETNSVVKNGISGTDVTVRLIDGDPEGHHHNHEPHTHRVGITAISTLIESSTLAQSVKAKAIAVFSALAEAESQVHGISAEQVHFHEVGALDAIVDICGTCVALEMLGVERIVCSPINLGGGSVKCAHGVLPVPAPATALLLRGMPVYGDDPRCGELTTPTGAAIVKTLCSSFGPLPSLRIHSVGYGLGKRQTGKVNALRVLLGEDQEQTGLETIVQLEANIDDMTGEALAFAADALREEGALDVSIIPAIMKKGRPGHIISVLCKALEEEEEKFAKLIFKHTSTLGVRIQTLKRHVLERECAIVHTPFGSIRVKQAKEQSRVLRAKPEFEDCAAAAKQHGAPLGEVIASIEAALRSEQETK